MRKALWVGALQHQTSNHIRNGAITIATLSTLVSIGSSGTIEPFVVILSNID